MAERESVLMVLEGRVQGVGFRFHVEAVARSLRLVGYVRNLFDGRVEAYAEGPKEVLEEFVPMVQRGPSMSVVTRMDQTWGSATGRYKDFRITF